MRLDTRRQIERNLLFQAVNVRRQRQRLNQTLYVIVDRLQINVYAALVREVKRIVEVLREGRRGGGCEYFADK